MAKDFSKMKANKELKSANLSRLKAANQGNNATKIESENATDETLAALNALLGNDNKSENLDIKETNNVEQEPQIEPQIVVPNEPLTEQKASENSEKTIQNQDIIENKTENIVIENTTSSLHENEDKIENNENKEEKNVQTIEENIQNNVENSHEEKLNVQSLEQVQDKAQDQIQEQVQEEKTVKTTRPRKRKLKIRTDIDFKAMGTTSWSCKIKPEALEKFWIATTQKDVQRYVLINSIIMNEIDYLEKNPETIDTKTILENMKAKRNFETMDAAFLISKENRDFIKSKSRSYGMNMVSYIEYLIDLYLD